MTDRTITYELTAQDNLSPIFAKTAKALQDLGTVSARSLDTLGQALASGTTASTQQGQAVSDLGTKLTATGKVAQLQASITAEWTSGLAAQRIQLQGLADDAERAARAQATMGAPNQVQYAEAGTPVESPSVTLPPAVRAALDEALAAQTAATEAKQSIADLGAAITATAGDYGAWEASNARMEEGLAALDESAQATGEALAVAGSKAAQGAGGVNELDSAVQKLPGHLAQTRDLIDEFGRAVENTLLYGTAFSALSQISGGITNTLKGVFSEAGGNEQYLATQAAQLGSVTAAQQRLNDVEQQAAQLGGQSLAVWKEQDERLAELGITAESAQQRFGRSLDQIRQDLLTLSQLPGVSADQAQAFFTRSADGAQRLVTSLQTAGVATKSELEQWGVTFGKSGTAITSSTQTTTDAVLNLVESKWGTLAEANSQTWDGVNQRVQNTWQSIEGTLGKDVTSKARVQLSALTAAFSAPSATAGLEKLATWLGDIADAEGRIANVGARATVGLLALVPGSWLPSDAVQRFDAYVAETDRLTQQETQAAAAGQTLAGGIGATATASDAATAAVAGLNQQLSLVKGGLSDLQAEAAAAVAPVQTSLTDITRTEAQRMQNFADAVVPLNAALDGVRASATASQRSYDDLIGGVQSKLQGLAGVSEQIRQKYADEIQPLKDQETALDRIYQQQTALKSLADAQTKLGTDTALAGDIFSSAGQAARDRLAADRQTVASQQASIQHDAAKAALEDRITGLERAQAIQEAGVQAEQRGLQTHLQGLEAARAKQAQIFQDQEAGITARIKQIDDARASEERYFTQVKTDLQDQITGIQDTYKNLESGFTTTEHTIEHAITTLQDGSAAALTVTDTNARTVLATIQRAVDQINQSALQIGISAGSQGAGTGPAWGATPPPGISNKPEIEISGNLHLINTGQGWRNMTAAEWAKYGIPGRASGGPVDAGWYTVGEHGPELLHAGGGGQVYPSGRGSAPPAINITVNGFVGSEMALAQQLSEILGAQFQGRNW